MSVGSDRLDLVVAAVSEEAPGIRHVRMRRPDGDALPAFTPGSHIVVEIPAGGDRTRTLANAYSLTGEPREPVDYEISVLRCATGDGGAGGSEWIHELAVGDPVTVLPPRSSFPPIRFARKHVLVAAGIGITPLLSHLRSHARWGHEVEVIYLYREGMGAHADEVAQLGGDRVTVVHDRASFLELLPERLSGQPIGTHVYTCGPASFMDTVVDIAVDAGWPDSRIHLEHFGIDALDAGDPFTVTVTDGPTIEVASGTSLLEALEDHGIAVPNLCRQGVCGECRVTVVPTDDGGPLHRDLYLSEEDKASGSCLMACVSRALPDANGRAHLEVTP